jgi:hypothetical protein
LIFTPSTLAIFSVNPLGSRAVEVEVIIFFQSRGIRREAIHVYSKEFLASANQAYFRFCARASTDLDPKGLINSSAMMKI